ncbi:MAG: hypothetical protein JWN76_3060 [Chitinophagaceae bacterium]|nr:hypothetical protein [Chitinophagaceae bacterium]
MEFSIFLVDDDEDGRSTLSLIFSRIGLSECITFFRDGNTLRKRLEQLPVSAYPELIGVDYRVQGNSGDEILTLLKN